MKARAFCPGHITGFFEICRADSVLATGSRGAGLCTTLGALSDVSLDTSDTQTINIEIDRVPREAEVTRQAVKRLIQERPVEVHIETFLDLPESQGFGMSAAGALSSCLAIAHLMGIDRQNAFEAAHAAEVECGAGLGDVSAIHRAGVTIREIPGLPPIGRVQRIEEAPDIVLAVVGPPIKTSGMLSDPAFAARINRSGSERVSDLLSHPTLQNLMRLASSFALETRLAQGSVLEAMEAASAAGDASMVMLGSSVFSVGRTEELESILREHGDVKRCGVDVEGVRIVGG
jgi:pantoate kinase